MPRILEDAFRWTHTGSTGSPKAHKVGPEADRFTFYFSGTFGSSATGSTAATASVVVQAALGSSAGPYVDLSSAVSTLSHPNSAVILQHTGPLEWVRPRVAALSASTETITCRMLAD